MQRAKNNECRKYSGCFRKNERRRNYENENYNEHLSYFKEAVLDDRLNFNQTHIVEKLGKLFLSYWDLLNSKYQARIKDLIFKFIEENGRLAKWNMKKPTDLTKVEEFFWEIKGLGFLSFERQRISDYIPKTCEALIEKETSLNDIIVRNK